MLLIGTKQQKEQEHAKKKKKRCTFSRVLEKVPFFFFVHVPLGHLTNKHLGGNLEV